MYGAYRPQNRRNIRPRAVDNVSRSTPKRVQTSRWALRAAYYSVNPYKISTRGERHKLINYIEQDNFNPYEMSSYMGITMPAILTSLRSAAACRPRDVRRGLSALRHSSLQ